MPGNQGSVTKGNEIILQYPTNSVFDLRSLPYQNGNQLQNAAKNYTQTLYLPRNGIASRINGRITIRCERLSSGLDTGVDR